MEEKEMAEEKASAAYDATQYEMIYKPNDITSHTVYHVKLSTLFSSVFSFHPNKEKFMLDNIIVCYLKLQGKLILKSKTKESTHLFLYDEGKEKDDKDKCNIYFHTGPGYETTLESFLPEENHLYEVFVKPNPREKNSFYAYTIHTVNEERRKEFLQRCKIEEDYYKKKSLENKKSLSSHLDEELLASSLLAKQNPLMTPIELVNEDILTTVSKHLLKKLDNGRLCQITSTVSAGKRKIETKVTKETRADKKAGDKKDKKVAKNNDRSSNYGNIYAGLQSSSFASSPFSFSLKKHNGKFSSGKRTFKKSF